MDPHSLIDATATAAPPAPLWFVHFFKVLGFTLHMVPMNLWYAGILLAMVFHVRGSGHARRFGRRLMAQMPLVIALGVNLGIVPLLFTQVAYPKFFYPATILMAWSHLAIVVLLIPAYYGVYVYALSLRGPADPTPLGRAAGWGAAALFIVIGFLFANGLSLTDHVDRWPQLWLDHSVGGATLGTALNVGDPTLWPRWLMMFGLALTTTAVWMLVDQAWFAAGESEGYRRWVWRAAPILYTSGIAWFAVAGSWYAWSGGVHESMFAGWRLVLTVATAVAPGLPWVLILAAGRRTSAERPLPAALVGLIALAQFGVLGINAISRQMVQSLNLAEYFAWPDQPVQQWSPLIVFLVVFVAGLGVVAWMVAQVVKAPARPST